MTTLKTFFHLSPPDLPYLKRIYRSSMIKKRITSRDRSMDPGLGIGNISGLVPGSFSSFLCVYVSSDNVELIHVMGLQVPDHRPRGVVLCQYSSLAQGTLSCLQLFPTSTLGHNSGEVRPHLCLLAHLARIQGLRVFFSVSGSSSGPQGLLQDLRVFLRSSVSGVKLKYFLDVDCFL